MIDVFKTSVQEISQRELMLKVLALCFPESEISLDLEDCDKVLRIKHDGIPRKEIIALLVGYGFQCEELQ